MNTCYHYETERKQRKIFIEKTIGYGEPVATVFRKSETSTKTRINVLSDTGVITVYTKDWYPVTVYIAGFSLACRTYRESTGEEPNEYLKNKFRLAQQYKELEP